MDEDQMLLRMLDRQRIDLLAKLNLYHDYNEMDTETRDRLTRRVDEVFDELAGRLKRSTW